jgi:hypothetical protein
VIDNSNPPLYRETVADQGYGDPLAAWTGRPGVSPPPTLPVLDALREQAAPVGWPTEADVAGGYAPARGLARLGAGRHVSGPSPRSSVTRATKA